MKALAVVCIGLAVAAARVPPSDVPPIRFDEIAAAAGVKVRHHTRTFKGPHADVLGMFTAGGASAAVADYDNDGFDDLFVTDSPT